MNEIVKLDITNRVALVKMEDRADKNTFTKDFVNAMIEVFSYIRNSQEVRAVVLTGYDKYFSCGASKNFLLQLQSCNSSDTEKKVDFNESGMTRLLVDCKVPVISAMQGHAVGGGFVFGLSADIVVLAEESVYTANFMKYGFTPGMGSTFILPYKLGNMLGTEMLYTAVNYRGFELKNRGINAKVEKKNDVLDVAMEIARNIAKKPLLSLVTLKNRFRAGIDDGLNNAIRDELKMHEITFAQDEVRKRIMDIY